MSPAVVNSLGPNYDLFGMLRIADRSYGLREDRPVVAERASTLPTILSSSTSWTVPAQREVSPTGAVSLPIGPHFR